MQRIIHRQGKIRNGAATLAYEMVVWFDVRVIAVKGAAEIDFSDQSLLHEYVQVPVHGAHAQVGKLRLQPVVDPAGGGMRPGILKKLVYPISLSASLVCLFQ